MLDQRSARLTPLGFAGRRRDQRAYASRALRVNLRAANDAVYDVLNRIAQTTDALGRHLTLAYDSAGRLTTQTLPDARTVTYAYDPAGNTTAITPPGRTAHNFGYTALDQAATYTPPDIGSGTTGNFQASCRQNTYIHAAIFSSKHTSF